MQKKIFYRPTYPIFIRTVTGNKQLLFLGLISTTSWVCPEHQFLAY